MSRAELNTEDGLIKDVHYGDVLIKYGEVLDVSKEEIPYISNQKYQCNNAALLQSGDVIIADAAEDEIVGKCSEIAGLSNQKILSGLHTIPCRPMKNFSRGYLGYYMNSESYHDQLLPLIQGTKISSISKSALKDTNIIYPNVEEQEQIGALFNSIDNLITLHQRKGEYLYIDQFWNYNKFTSTWEQRKLGNIIDLRSGRDYKHLSAGEIPVYGTGGYMLSVNEALSYKEDAIGIGRKGTIDKPYILKAPFWTVDTLFYALPETNNDSDFIFDIFQNINWKQRDESTGVPSLSKTAINEIDVLIPEFKEQKIIGNFFQYIDNLITLHQRELDKLKNIKKACLEKMFI